MGTVSKILRKAFFNPTYIYIEIIPNDPKASLSTFCIPCNCVRNLIIANIKTACAKLHYAEDNIDYHISFECPCNQPENFHPAALRPDMNNCFVCVQSKKVIDVRKECYVWLPQVSELLHSVKLNAVYIKISLVPRAFPSFPSLGLLSAGQEEAGQRT